MKKILLGTTAIIGASLLAGPALAEKPKLSMSGNVKFEAAFVSEDDGSVNGSGNSDFNRGYKFSVDDAEIVFKASATADNGLEYGAKIEYEFEKSSTDEAMIWFEGDWGTINLGNEDGADDLMKVAGFSALGGTGGWDGENFVTNNSSALIAADLVGDNADDTKITYLTPGLSGFRAGVSFTPDGGHTYDAAFNDDNGDQENHIGVGVEYKGDFDQVGVHVSGRYMTAGYESNDVGDTTEKEEVNVFALGGKVSFGDFAIAAGYGDNDDSGVTKADSATGVDAGVWYDAAVQYASGPIKVAAGYYHSEIQATATAEAEADIFTVTADYNVADGLDVYGEFNYYELEDGTTATTADNEANVFIVGTKVSF